MTKISNAILGFLFAMPFIGLTSAAVAEHDIPDATIAFEAHLGSTANC